MADRGYHSNDVLTTLTELDIRTYIAEPKRPRRRWRGQQAVRDAVYGNRRRQQRAKAKALHKRRGELVERSFAHCLETGAMRRTHLRGHDNIAKRYLVHVAAFNLGLMMRRLIGVGTPKGLSRRAVAALEAAWERLIACWSRLIDLLGRCAPRIADVASADCSRGYRWVLA